MNRKRLALLCSLTLFTFFVCLQSYYLNQWAGNQHSIVRPNFDEPTSLSFCLHIVHAYRTCIQSTLALNCLSDHPVEYCNYQMMFTKKSSAQILSELRRCRLFRQLQLLHIATTQSRVDQLINLPLLNLTFHYMTDGLYCERIDMATPSLPDGSTTLTKVNDGHKRYQWDNLAISSAPENTIVFIHSADQLARRIGDQLHVLTNKTYKVIRFSRILSHTNQQLSRCRSYSPSQSQVSCIEQCEKRSYQNMHFRFQYMPGESLPLQFSQLVIHLDCEDRCPPSCVHRHFLLHSVDRLPVPSTTPILQASFRRLTQWDMLIEYRTQINSVAVFLYTMQIVAIWLSIGVRCIQRLTSAEIALLETQPSPRRCTPKPRVSRFQVSGSSWNRSVRQTRFTLQRHSDRCRNLRAKICPSVVITLAAHRQASPQQTIGRSMQLVKIVQYRLIECSKLIASSLHRAVRSICQHFCPFRRSNACVRKNSCRLANRCWWLVSIVLLSMGFLHIHDQTQQSELLMDFKLHTQFKHLRVCVCFSLRKVSLNQSEISSFGHIFGKEPLPGKMNSSSLSLKELRRLKALTLPLKKMLRRANIGLNILKVRKMPHHTIFFDGLKCYCLRLDLITLAGQVDRCPDRFQSTNDAIEQLVKSRSPDVAKQIYQAFGRFSKEAQENETGSSCVRPKAALRHQFITNWPTHKLTLYFKSEIDMYWFYTRSQETNDLHWSRQPHPELLLLKRKLLPNGANCRRVIQSWQHKFRSRCWRRTKSLINNKFMYQNWFVHQPLLRTPILPGNQDPNWNVENLRDVRWETIDLKCSNQNLSMTNRMELARTSSSGQACDTEVVVVQNKRSQLYQRGLWVPLRVPLILQTERWKLSKHEALIQSMALFSVLYSCGLCGILVAFIRTVALIWRSIRNRMRSFRRSFKVVQHSRQSKRPIRLRRRWWQRIGLWIALLFHLWIDLCNRDSLLPLTYLQPYVDSWTPVFAFCIQSPINESFANEGHLLQHFFKSISFSGLNRLQVRIDRPSLFQLLGSNGYFDCLNVYLVRLPRRICITLQLGGFSQRLMLSRSSQNTLKTSSNLINTGARETAQQCNQPAGVLQSNLMLDLKLRIDTLELFVSSDLWIIDSDKRHRLFSSIEIAYEKHRRVQAPNVDQNEDEPTSIRSASSTPRPSPSSVPLTDDNVTPEVTQNCNNHSPDYEKALIEWIDAYTSMRIRLLILRNNSMEARVIEMRHLTDIRNYVPNAFQPDSQVTNISINSSVNYPWYSDQIDRTNTLLTVGSLIKFDQMPLELYMFREWIAWKKLLLARKQRQCTEYFRTAVRRLTTPHGVHVRLVRGPFEWIRKQEDQLQHVKAIVHGTVLLFFYTEFQVFRIVQQTLLRWSRLV
jgi:hypothetical protein